MMNGMRGVFRAADELTKREFIDATTSRHGAGADLLVTDVDRKNSWSVEVVVSVRSSLSFGNSKAWRECFKRPAPCARALRKDSRAKIAGEERPCRH